LATTGAWTASTLPSLVLAAPQLDEQLAPSSSSFVYVGQLGCDTTDRPHDSVHVQIRNNPVIVTFRELRTERPPRNTGPSRLVNRA
jgi:hypothetical protein